MGGTVLDDRVDAAEQPDLYSHCAVQNDYTAGGINNRIAVREIAGQGPIQVWVQSDTPGAYMGIPPGSRRSLQMMAGIRAASQGKNKGAGPFVLLHLRSAGVFISAHRDALALPPSAGVGIGGRGR
jgi:hypothetical protein